MMRRLHALSSIQNLLMLILLGLAGVAAESFRPGGVVVDLWLLAIAAGVLGIVLGILRTPDSLSHLVAIGTGFGTAVSLATLRLAQDAPGSSFRDRLDAVGSDLWDWYLGTGSQQDTNDMLIGILLQMIVWLGSYLAAWALVRRGWVTVSLVLPGTIVFGARVGGFDTPPYLLEIYIVLAVMLLARTTFVRRAGQRVTSDAGERRGWVSLLMATVVGVLVVTVGLATPEDFSTNTMQPIAEYAGDAYLRAQDRTTAWLGENLDLGGSRVPDIDDYPRYTAFDDAFSIGGDLNLSDQPEVLVRTDGAAPYLSAQSYDRYTGRGWESTVEDTFEEDGPDGVRYSPELTFRAGQNVPYSQDVSQQRSEVTIEVTPLRPPADIVFADGQFVTANERASVRMSWQQLEGERFSLRDIDLSAVPRDLLGIASMLLRADELTVEGDSGLLYPSTAADRDSLQAARAELSERFIDVGWTVAPDGRVDEMIVTGQVPVYDDNVAVERASSAGVNDSYLVTSAPSIATEDELRAASTEYPTWVSGRYLSLPTGTVTDRTVDLTREITAGVSNSFDQAQIVEAFLREHIEYDLEVGIPAEGVDIVDYVLFELPRGYCEHYASAMTVMLRTLGIPARTVVGYFPGEYDDERGGYLYRQENAHAWTEAFFPGYGWVRFEPTSSQPASSFEELQPTPPAETPAATPTPATETPVATPAPSTPDIQDDTAPIADMVQETSPDDDNGPTWPVLAVGAVVVVTVGAVAAWWLLTWAPALEPRALFSGLVRWGRAGGVPADDTVTPREYARNVGRRYPHLASDADRIVDVYEDQRYGGKAPARSTLQVAADALRNFRRAVIRRFVRLGR